MSEQSIVEAVTERIALQIASGAYRAGERLPSVRQLAIDFSINASTVQVVLGRLHAAGFVESHRGVGFLVRDVRLEGGIETLRYLFRFAAELPELAQTILADMLATRWTLLSEAAAVLADNPGKYEPSTVRRAVRQLEQLAAHERVEPPALASAELGVYRAVMATLDRPVALAVINSIEAILLGVPEVLEALYTFPSVHVEFWKHVLTLWEDGEFTHEVIAGLAAAVRLYDSDATRRLHEMLSARGAGAE
ncbi:GntR family transcriptional regulator [Nocardia brasiliensis]